MVYRFMRYPGGKAKAVTFSYDDGIKHDKRLSDIITPHGIKCTFNIMDTTVGGDALSSAEIKEYILDRGHEVAVHNLHHMAPGLSSTLDGIQNTLYCKAHLEEEFGIIVRGMAYPDSGITRFESGYKYEDVRNYLQYLGIAYSRTLGTCDPSMRLPNDWYAWMPTAHHNDEEIWDLIDQLVEMDPNTGYCADNVPRLLYIWGHSYEFEQCKINNWTRLEKIVEKIGDKDDIWYATNIEIHDYVEAYNRLQFSADGLTVHNPTATEVFFRRGDKDYSVKPGETKKLK